MGFRVLVLRSVLCLPAFWILPGGLGLLADEPVALRVESLGVPPSTGPLIFVDVKNQSDAAYQGRVALNVPDGWRIDPTNRDVSLQPGEMKRVTFVIEQGRNLKENSYPIEVSATSGDTIIVRRQDVVCASAPYFKPDIDGDPSDWTDAIPVTFVSEGKKTVISTFWNRRQFSILLAVEEDELVPFSGDVFDAVQLALSPQGSTTGALPEDDAERFEFLFVATGNAAQGKCFQLAEPETKLAECQQPRELGPLEYEKAKVAVSRTGGITFYECSIPFRPMREEIRPSEGREFFLSVLVHDPDGTGIRDWGQAAGLWPSQRNRMAWSLWPGAAWGEKPPFDNKLQWGLCTSKY